MINNALLIDWNQVVIKYIKIPLYINIINEFIIIFNCKSFLNTFYCQQQKINQIIILLQNKQNQKKTCFCIH